MPQSPRRTISRQPTHSVSGLQTVPKREPDEPSNRGLQHIVRLSSTPILNENRNNRHSDHSLLQSHSPLNLYVILLSAYHYAEQDSFFAKSSSIRGLSASGASVDR